MKVIAVIVDELPPACTWCDYNGITGISDPDADLGFICAVTNIEREMPNDEERYDFCPLRLETGEDSEMQGG